MPVRVYVLELRDPFVSGLPDEVATNSQAKVAPHMIAWSRIVTKDMPHER